MQRTNPAPLLPDRRSFLWSLAGLGVAGKALALKPQKDSETVYRFTTPECEVQMSVEYFGSSEVHSLRFRDFLSHHAFCLSANGAEDPACVQRFSGSLAIAHYRFRSRHHARMPLTVRERVLTIDHDSRLDPRPPFEKLLAVDGEPSATSRPLVTTRKIPTPQPPAPARSRSGVSCVRTSISMKSHPPSSSFTGSTPSTASRFSMSSPASRPTSSVLS